MTLLILAAGMGSRYGGLKQMDPMGPSGETVLDYSVYDALRAGFEKIAFVIREDFEEAFRREIGARFESLVPVSYAFQSLDLIPLPFTVPPGRDKPWGTGHAILCAREVVDEPFAVINADDFYGAAAYRAVRGFLAQHPERDSAQRDRYCMAGYLLRNTLSEYGGVARGICRTGEDNELLSVTEVTSIERDEAGPFTLGPDGVRQAFTGAEWVSMNFWGLRPSVFGHLETLFREFLPSAAETGRGEFYIPSAIDTLIQRQLAGVTVLPVDCAWFGITYREDKPRVVSNLRRLIDSGLYPENLWAQTPVSAP